MFLYKELDIGDFICATKLVGRTAATLCSTRAAFHTTSKQLCSDKRRYADKMGFRAEAGKEKVGV